MKILCLFDVCVWQVCTVVPIWCVCLASMLRWFLIMFDGKKVEVSKIGMDASMIYRVILHGKYMSVLKIKEKKENFAIHRSINVQAQQLAKASLQSLREFIHICKGVNAYPEHE